MSLGVPWLIRNIIYYNTTDKSFITLNSFGIEYTIASLLVATVLLYAVLRIAKYHLNKTVGFSLLSIYSIFLTIGVLLELDIIFPSGNCLWNLFIRLKTNLLMFEGWIIKNSLNWIYCYKCAPYAEKECSLLPRISSK